MEINIQSVRVFELIFSPFHIFCKSTNLNKVRFEWCTLYRLDSFHSHFIPFHYFVHILFILWFFSAFYSHFSSSCLFHLIFYIHHFLFDSILFILYSPLAIYFNKNERKKKERKKEIKWKKNPCDYNTALAMLLNSYIDWCDRELQRMRSIRQIFKWNSLKA